MHKISAILSLWLLLAQSGDARADAALRGDVGTFFPATIAVDISVRAQVEVTTMTLGFAPLASGGNYVLTVPGPEGAYSIGVDIDRGAGFVPLAMTEEPPPPGVGSGTGADPAVQAWQGHTPLLADLADLDAGELTVRVRFLRLLRRHQGSVVFTVAAERCPLREDGDVGATFSLSATVDTLGPLASVVAAPPAAVVDQGENRAVIEIATTTLSDAVSAEISYAEEIDAISARFLAHRTPEADPLGGEDGYFLLVVDADEVTVAGTKPRTLNMVIDRSGSMSGAKIAQAREAAGAMLDNLRDSDEFNLLVFDDAVDSLWSAARPASAGNLAAARDYIETIEADGSTDLDAAVVQGLGGSTESDEERADERFDALILLSDGQATAGETDPVEIHRRSILYNRWKARIFSVAVGQGADIPLMEALARSSRGRSFALNESQATSELVATVRRLFEDIYAVRLTDMEVSVIGVEPAEVLPENAPDLFNGGQVLVVGRYRNPGAGSVRVTGDAAGTPYELDIPADAPELSEDNEFVKYVWATEKVGQLLAEMASGGNRDELRARIIEIGLGYRIQTPFTSFSSAGGGDAAIDFATQESAGCRIRRTAPGPGGVLLGLLAVVGIVVTSRRRDRSARASR